MLVGSPQTVRQKLAEYQKDLGVGVVLTGCQTGTLSHELTRKSMAMLAKEVLPPTPQVGIYKLTAVINHSPTGDPNQLTEMFGFAESTPIDIRQTVVEVS